MPTNKCRVTELEDHTFENLVGITSGNSQFKNAEIGGCQFDETHIFT